MFSQKTREEMIKEVSDRIFERAEEDRRSLDQFRQSNPGVVSSVPDTPLLQSSGIFSQEMTKEEAIKAASDRIFERAEQDKKSLDQFRQSSPRVMS